MLWWERLGGNFTFFTDAGNCEVEWIYKILVMRSCSCQRSNV